jgi:hypothetical protein
MISDKNFYDIFFTFFYPTASTTAYGRRPKFVRAEHSATAEGGSNTAEVQGSSLIAGNIHYINWDSLYSSLSTKSSCSLIISSKIHTIGGRLGWLTQKSLNIRPAVVS